MSNEFINKIILNYVIQKNNTINNKKLNILLDNYSNIKLYLENLLEYYTSYNEIIYRILYNEEKQHYCPVCNKPLKYYRKHKWAAHCSTKCSSLDKEVQRKLENTCLKKYNVKRPANLDTNCFKTNNPQKNKIIQEKTKQTCLRKYGVEYSWNSKSQKETLIKKYGVDNIRKSEYFKEKSKQTKFEKYGDENYNNREKFKITCTEKYGVDNYTKTNQYKCSIDWELRNYKSNITKRNNGTFNKSKPEDIVYKLLIEKYDNVIRQYTDNRYPFNCDFYIPKLDLFIEFQGSHFHNKHPFNKNDEFDLELLKKLQEKDKQSIRTINGKESQYHRIIYVWTNLDVRKRNIAKQNKLNFIEFWNIDEVKNWLK